MGFEFAQCGGGRGQCQVRNVPQLGNFVLVRRAKANRVVEHVADLVAFWVEAQVVDLDDLFSEPVTQIQQNLPMAGFGREIFDLVRVGLDVEELFGGAREKKLFLGGIECPGLVQ